MSARTAVEASMARWMAALNARGEAGALREAVAADVLIVQFGHGPTAGEEVGRHAGLEAVAGWLVKIPADTRWRCEIQSTGPGAVDVRYRHESPMYAGNGSWSITLSPAGLVQTLEHRPDDHRPENHRQ